MKLTFAAMEAGVMALALAEIFGFEDPGHTALGPENKPDSEEAVKRAPLLGFRAFPDPRKIDYEQPHTHVEPVEDISKPTTLALGYGAPGKERPRYVLTLSPISTSPLIVKKIGDPVVWRSLGLGGGWKGAAGNEQMIGQETDIGRLRGELEEKLHLPHKQISTLIAMLLAGQSIVVGSDLEEDSPQAVDSNKLRQDLKEVHDLPSEHIEKVLALVSGQNPALIHKSPCKLANASTVQDEPGVGLGRNPTAWGPFNLPEGWEEAVLHSIPRLSQPFNSVRTFTREELERFGLTLGFATFTLRPGT